MLVRERRKGEQILYYNIDKYKLNGSFEIVNYICEIFTLLKLMEKVGNVNHAVSIVGNWIFDYNY